ncbi:MAG: F0F1 ATP synthase subunit B' [Alphaproteobacteria bacterium]
MPQLDTATFAPQLVWLAITFIALYLILGRRLLPRIGEILESRQDKIAHDLGAAEAARKEAEAATTAYEASLAKARADAQALRVQTIEESRAASAARQDDLAADLAREAAAAERAIGAAKARALDDIERAAAEVAQAAVARLIGVEVDADRALAAVRAERS